VEAQPTVFDQDQRRRGGDRLGHRGDAEDRVAAHRRLGLERLPADRLDMRLAAPADQPHDARHGAARDVRGPGILQAWQAGPGEGAAHRVDMKSPKRSRPLVQPPRWSIAACSVAKPVWRKVSCVRPPPKSANVTATRVSGSMLPSAYSVL